MKLGMDDFYNYQRLHQSWMIQLESAYKAQQVELGLSYSQKIASRFPVTDWSKYPQSVYERVYEQALKRMSSGGALDGDYITVKLSPTDEVVYFFAEGGEIKTRIARDEPPYSHTDMLGYFKRREELRQWEEEQKRQEEENLRLWGRKDDPRLDPTSELYDPLKLVYKDGDNDQDS